MIDDGTLTCKIMHGEMANPNQPSLMALQDLGQIEKQPHGEQHRRGELSKIAEEPQSVDPHVLGDLLRVDRHDGEPGCGGEGGTEAHLGFNSTFKDTRDGWRRQGFNFPAWVCNWIREV